MAYTGQQTHRERLAARVDRVRRDDLVGYALLLAADDWHRVLPARFVPRERLVAQARRHLSDDWPQLATDDAALAAAVDAAVEPPALLEHDGDGRFRMVCMDGEPVLPPDEPRRAAPLTLLTPLEAVDVANRRREAGELPQAAIERVYRYAEAGDDPDAAAFAALGLADFALEQRDLDLARLRYVEVAALDHEDASLRARLALAEMAVAEGDLIGAGQYAQQVADTVHPDVAAEALEFVSELQWELGRWDDALATVRRAVDPDDPLRTPSLTLRLARMLVVQGQTVEALPAYEQLLREPTVGSSIAIEYVTSAAMVGRLERARAALAGVLDPADPITFCPYALALAEAHFAAGESAQAAALVGRASAHPGEKPVPVAVYADVLTARLAALDGDAATAERIYTSLTDTDDPARRDAARPLLVAEGLRLRDQGVPCTVPGFRPVLEYLTEAGAGEDAAWAMYSLGLTALQRHRLEEAESALRLVARYGDTDSLPAALAAVSHVRQLAGDHHGSVDNCLDLINHGSLPVAIESLHVATLVLIRAAASADPASAVAGGQHALDPGTVAVLRERVRDAALVRIETVGADEQAGQLAYAVAVFDSVPPVLGGSADAAADMFEFAARTGPLQLAGPAWLQAGILREELGQPLRAVAAYQEAVAGENPGVAGESALRLAGLARQLGDDDLALESYGRGLEHGSAQAFAECAFALGLALELSHPDDAEAAFCAVRDEPAADPHLVGRALARLGALYARHGNRRLAQRVWRRARRDPHPLVSKGFATERQALGRVRRLPRRP